MASRFVKLVFVSSFLLSTVQAAESAIRQGTNNDRNREINDERKPDAKEVENETHHRIRGVAVNKQEWIKNDIEIIAKSAGWSPEAANEHVHLQESFKVLVAGLEKHEGYADAIMAMNPGDNAAIYFKDKVPTNVAKNVRDFSDKHKLNVEIVITRFSLKEHEARAENIVQILEKKGFSNVGYSLGPGDALVIMASPPKTLRIKETLEPPSDEIDLDVIDKTASNVLSTHIGNDGLRGVRLIISKPQDNDPIEVEDHTRGGRKIYRMNTSQCTTGFTVMNSAGITGVGTAGHCTGMNMYDAEPPESDYGTSWKGQHIGGWGDFEWHTTPHIEPAEYWASPSQKRIVQSVDNNFVQNEWVCGYSRMKGVRFCDRIYRTNVSMSGRSRLVAMRNRNMTGGDSGGPWSFWTRAAGFHTGGRKIWFKWRDVWSRAMYLPVAITGVVVRTI